MRKHKGEEKGQNEERWLLTYADMMNNLLILFMVLYSMSVIDLNKFKALAKELNNAFSTTSVTQDVSDIGAGSGDGLGQDTEETGSEDAAGGEQPSTEEQFNQVYETLKIKMEENGYNALVSMEKGGDYIKFRFGDNVLFYPDSPQMKTGNTKVLKYIGDILLSVDNLIETVEIGGHTATTGEKTDSFFSWELSSERALAVLEYLVDNCNLPESKMSISGYSRYHPIASNETEDSRQLNRRVEIKITRVSDDNGSGTSDETAETATGTQDTETGK